MNRAPQWPYIQNAPIILKVWDAYSQNLLPLNFSINFVASLIATYGNLWDSCRNRMLCMKDKILLSLLNAQMLVKFIHVPFKIH
jgi:hypothetical protein